MAQDTKMDPEMLSMVLDTIDKLERDRLSLETKLELDRIGDFPMDLIRFIIAIGKIYSMLISQLSCMIFRPETLLAG